MIWEFLSPTFGNFSPQLLGIFAPNFWKFLSPTFGDFCPQLLGIWEFLSPKVGDKNSQTVGDKKSIPMGIIVVPNFPHRNLNIVPNFLGFFVTKKVGGNNSIPMIIYLLSPTFFGWEKLGTILCPIGIELLSRTFWEFLSPTFPQKLGAKIPKSWGQKIPKGWGQKIPNPQKLGT